MRANLDYPRFAIAGLSLFLMGVVCSPASAVLINVQFTTSGPAVEQMAAQSGPALIGTSGDYWNQWSPIIGPGPLALNDSTGNATPVQAAFLQQFRGIYGKLASPPVVWPFDGTPYASLMDHYAYIYQSDGGSVLRLTNVPNGAYDLYLYSSPSPDAVTRVTHFLAATSTGGPTATVGPYAGATTFIEGVNYAHFHIDVGDGTIGIGYTGVVQDLPNASEGDINGFQLISAPEPASALVVSLALAGGLLRRRRKTICKAESRS